MLIKRWIAIILSIIAIGSGTYDGILRLHVVANSNSAQDQSVKLQVRDGILAYVGKNMQAANAKQAHEFIAGHMDELETLAQNILKEQGMNYGAAGILGRFSFPQKAYGNMVLPEGEYQALRIELGSGAGDNWWCILFPPLCLVESTQTDPQWSQDQGVEYDSFFLEILGGKE